MPHISRFRLKDDVLRKLFSLFFEIVGKNKNKDRFLSVIGDLLSPTERIMIAKRLAIIYLVLKDIDYVIICDVLKVSSAIVYKFRLLVEKSEDGVVQEFKSILRNESAARFIAEMFLTISPPGTPGTNWRSRWNLKLALDRDRAQGI